MEQYKPKNVKEAVINTAVMTGIATAVLMALRYALSKPFDLTELVTFCSVVFVLNLLMQVYFLRK